jgi:heme/copper-type cytochrome/quinol oxidase subunit 3
LTSQIDRKFGHREPLRAGLLAGLINALVFGLSLAAYITFGAADHVSEFELAVGESLSFGWYAGQFAFAMVFIMPFLLILSIPCATLAVILLTRFRARRLLVWAATGGILSATVSALFQSLAFDLGFEQLEPAKVFATSLVAGIFGGAAGWAFLYRRQKDQAA